MITKRNLIKLRDELDAVYEQNKPLISRLYINTMKYCDYQAFMDTDGNYNYKEDEWFRVLTKKNQNKARLITMLFMEFLIQSHPLPHPFQPYKQNIVNKT